MSDDLIFNLFIGLSMLFYELLVSILFLSYDARTQTRTPNTLIPIII